MYLYLVQTSKMIFTNTLRGFSSVNNVKNGLKMYSYLYRFHFLKYCLNHQIEL